MKSKKLLFPNKKCGNLKPPQLKRMQIYEIVQSYRHEYKCNLPRTASNAIFFALRKASGDKKKFLENVSRATCNFSPEMYEFVL